MAGPRVTGPQGARNAFLKDVLRHLDTDEHVVLDAPRGLYTTICGLLDEIATTQDLLTASARDGDRLRLMVTEAGRVPRVEVAQLERRLAELQADLDWERGNRAFVTGVWQERLGAERKGTHDRLNREVAETRAAKEELVGLLELQRSRMRQATQLWQAEDPKAREMVLPDLPQLLAWLMKRADVAQATAALDNDGR